MGQLDSVEEESSEEEEDDDDDDEDDSQLGPVRRQWKEFLQRHAPRKGHTEPVSPAEPTPATSVQTGRELLETQHLAPPELAGETAWSVSHPSDWPQPPSSGPAKSSSYAETQLFQRPEEVEVIVEKRLGLTDEDDETETTTEATPSAENPAESVPQLSRDDRLSTKEAFGTPLTNDVIERKIQLSQRRRRRRRQAEDADAAPAAESSQEETLHSMASRVIPLTYNGHRGRINQTMTLLETSHSEMMSSFSSSEEALLSCPGVIVNQPLRASTLCSGGIHANAEHLTVQVIGDDYYYLVFSSENEILDVDVFFDVMLEKTVYDVRAAESVCGNSTECNVPLGFWSGDSVVLEYPVGTNASEAVWSEHYTVRSTCQPRGWIVAVFIVAALFSLFVCAFC